MAWALRTDVATKEDMRKSEHHVQDALEHYAAARMQLEAEALRVAISRDADKKHQAFVDYATAREYTVDWFDGGPWKMYKQAYDRHLPRFVQRLAAKFYDQTFDFIAVEAAYRNEGKKGDFIVLMAPAATTRSVSLKNYRGDIRRPQFNAQTYNSFVLGFLFAARVGMYVDPLTGLRFKGSTVIARDAALRANGYGEIVPAMHELDQLNRDIKAQFVYDPRFEHLDSDAEAIFDAARKRVGNAGADLVAGIVAVLDPALIKNRLLSMTGLDGAEDLLIMDAERAADTLTNQAFDELREIVQAGRVEWERRGQSIVFNFVSEGRHVLPVNVPFTINKNGAWVSEPTPPEGAYHAKEGLVLRYGDRRPKKSKELATSINTYVDFAATGIFAET